MKFFKVTPSFLLLIPTLLVLGISAQCDQQSIINQCLASAKIVMESCNGNLECLCTQLKVAATCYDRCPNDQNSKQLKQAALTNAGKACSGSKPELSVTPTVPASNNTTSTTGSGSKSTTSTSTATSTSGASTTPATTTSTATPTSKSEASTGDQVNHSYNMAAAMFLVAACMLAQ